MGFWNITAKELREGDEVRVTTMGGVEYLTVRKVCVDGANVGAKLAWGLHVPNGEPFWDNFAQNERLTVRR